MSVIWCGDMPSRFNYASSFENWVGTAYGLRSCRSGMTASRAAAVSGSGSICRFGLVVNYLAFEQIIEEMAFRGVFISARKHLRVNIIGYTLATQSACRYCCPSFASAYLRRKPNRPANREDRVRPSLGIGRRMPFVAVNEFVMGCA